MRSLLFVPGDSPRKLEKALRADADALIVDLEDSVALARKGEARRTALGFLRETQSAAARPRIFVRINALDTALADADLDVIMTAAPDGIMLPKAGGGQHVGRLASRLAVTEALHGWPDGITRILPIATETAAALFRLGSYAGSSPRLCGLTWGAEDLSAEIGATANRDGGSWTEPFRLARGLCLFAAAAAGVPAIDTVHLDLDDEEGLRCECRAAARDGFSGKLAIHPAQVAVINEAFTPGAEAVARAERIVETLQQSAAGVAALDGAMIDQPHLRAAERLLARAGKRLR